MNQIKQLAKHAATLLESLFLPLKALVACWNAFQLKTKLYGKNLILYPLKGVLYVVLSPVLLLLALDGVLKDYGSSLKQVTVSFFTILGTVCVLLLAIFATIESDNNQ